MVFELAFKRNGVPETPHFDMIQMSCFGPESDNVLYCDGCSCESRGIVLSTWHDVIGVQVWIKWCCGSVVIRVWLEFAPWPWPDSYSWPRIFGWSSGFFTFFKVTFPNIFGENLFRLVLFGLVMLVARFWTGLSSRICPAAHCFLWRYLFFLSTLLFQCGFPSDYCGFGAF